MTEIGIKDEQLKQALERIGRTSDGVTLYLFLQKTRSVVLPYASADALRENEARRTFAAELMTAMADGIRAAHDGRDPTDRPIVFLAREPADVSGRRGSARDWLRANDPELIQPKPGAGTG